MPSPGNFSWSCPYCERDTTVTYDDRESGRIDFKSESADGRHILDYMRIVCPNPECARMSLSVELHEGGVVNKTWRSVGLRNSWRLVPPPSGQVFPDYVPQAIRDDYGEACLIRTLSPKASATLSRRCLQGMIRDYWKIAKGRLKDEIDELKGKVDQEVWEAIDAVRSVGNVGAHTEKDVNVIIDVEPEEADQLIWLIELLIREWYIRRHDRQESLKAVSKLTPAKARAKKAPASDNSDSTP